MLTVRKVGSIIEKLKEMLEEYLKKTKPKYYPPVENLLDLVYEHYNAANHLRASRNYTRKNRPLPVLSVVDDGILRGYVPFDKDWTGFSAEEYREASESVMQEEQENTAEVMNRLNLSGYEVVRAQYFSTLQNPAMTILDLCDRRIVSYVIRDRNDNKLVFDTLDKAVLENPNAHPLFHSDRGFQYTSRTFHKKLLDAGMTQSMSRVGRCIDNGPMESIDGKHVIKSASVEFVSFIEDAYLCLR